MLLIRGIILLFTTRCSTYFIKHIVHYCIFVTLCTINAFSQIGVIQNCAIRQQASGAIVRVSESRLPLYLKTLTDIFCSTGIISFIKKTNNNHIGNCRYIYFRCSTKICLLIQCQRSTSTSPRTMF